MSQSSLQANTDIPEDSDSHLNRDPTVRLFWMVMLCHVIAWVSVCVWTQPNMPLDMVEMLYWGQQWELGYHKHPPLPAWIAAGTWALSGPNAWLMYVVSQLTIVVTLWSVWQLAREGLSPMAAICSVFLLEACYYCTFMINDINNTIITRPFWALSILFLYRALTRQNSVNRNFNWCLAGAAIGLGMISKYYLGVLVLAMLTIPVLLPRTRASLKTAGPYLLGLVSTAIFAPHLWWMIENDFITIRYVFNRSDGSTSEASFLDHVAAPLRFLGSQLGAVVPMLVLAWPLYLQKRRSSRPNDPDGTFFRRYVMIVVLGPILIYLIVSAVMGASIRSMWGGPLFSFVGVLLFATFELPSDRTRLPKIFRASLAFGAVMLLAMTVRNLWGPQIRGELSRVHFPGIQLADKVNEIWDSRFDGDLGIVGGDMFAAGSASAYSAQHVDVYVSPEASPWLDDAEINRRGGVFVWEIEDGLSNPLEPWLPRFKDAELLKPIEIESDAIGGPYSVKVALMVIPPDNSSNVSADSDSPNPD